MIANELGDLDLSMSYAAKVNERVILTSIGLNARINDCLMSRHSHTAIQ
jgi:hypothetical protein